MTSEQLWAELLLVESDEDGDGERAAELVHELNRLGDPDVVTWALPLLRDEDASRRHAAAWVLGEHGYERGRPYGAAVNPELARAAAHENDGDTRARMVTSLGRAEDPDWVGELLRHESDPYPPVREAVAAELPLMFGGDPMSSDAVAALVRLTEDTDPHVRDWATMSLGFCDEFDDEVRSAVRARLNDDDPDGSATSGGAALALAAHGDGFVYPYLQRWLASRDVGNLIVEAAGALGDPRLLPALHALRDAGWDRDDEPRPETLHHAIAALERAEG